MLSSIPYTTPSSDFGKRLLQGQFPCVRIRRQIRGRLPFRHGQAHLRLFLITNLLLGRRYEYNRPCSVGPLGDAANQILVVFPRKILPGTDPRSASLVRLPVREAFSNIPPSSSLMMNDLSVARIGRLQLLLTATCIF
jgi:hypothetical protein